MLQLESKIPVLVDFSAVWCGPCQMVEPILAELAKKYEAKIKFVKVDIDKEPELAEKYQVMSVPTVIVFKKGKEIARQVGLLNKAGFEELIKKLCCTI